jgi:hypothetical protein
MTPLIKCAINTRVINKPQPDDKAAWKSLASEWQNVEQPIIKFAAHVNNGNPFCAQMLNRRSNINFMGTNILTVDIDEGWTLPEFLNDDFVKNFGAMVYTTPSHTEARHRLRGVFLMEQEIIDPTVMRSANIGLIRKFGGDMACNDVCRLYFGSKGSNPIILGNVLPSVELERLVLLGSTQRISDSDGDPDDTSKRIPVGNRSNVNLRWDQTVRLPKGGTVPLQSLEVRTPIFCPEHQDIRHASAMVVVNKEGKRGVFCSKCCETFWPIDPNRAERMRYDFNSVPELIRELAGKVRPPSPDDNVQGGQQ